MLSRSRITLGKLLAALIVINTFAGIAPLTVRAQRRVIVVNADQPNLWTLEQAHYLLAQMHRRNLDLRAKRLEDLDPNEIAGLRFDVMRMLVEFGATFNQADLASNRLLSENRTFNTERRQELLTERDSRRREALRLTAEIEELQIEKSNTTDGDVTKRLDAQINAKTTRLARVDKEVEQINGELATLAAPSGTPAATTGGATFNPEKLPDSVFDEAFAKAAAKQIEKFNDAPKLNASLRLDNFIQMQYEIISKQLSLLRDELGPGERLVFLELPQTVNAAHHESERKWAQSWWKIAGYTRRVRTNDPQTTRATPPPPALPNQKPITTSQDMNSILERQAIPVAIATPAACVEWTPESHGDMRAIRIVDGPPPPPTPAPAPAPDKKPSPKAKPIAAAAIPAPATPPTPNPSSIEVSKVSGRVRKVTVTLNGIRHPNPDDLDIMLVGPQGQNVMLMSDVGGVNPAGDLTLTLDDAALNGLPDAGPLVSGTYRPTDYEAGADQFLKPAPAPLGGSSLSVFNGTNPTGKWSLYIMDDAGAVGGSLGGGWSLNITTDCRQEMPQEVRYQDVFVNLDNVAKSASALWDSYLSKDVSTKLENRAVRTVDLIPRQSSLNVNDMNLQSKAGAFNFVLSTLFGFGASLNVQRQREQFSQFVQQELYSAAFGKGSREFGWTFTPMPGMERLQSGVRTTYAVIVVPEDATSLVLEANGCYFPRSYYPPNDFADTKSNEWNIAGRTSRNCGGSISDGSRSRAFVVPIPSARPEGGNEFWVEKMSFQPVGKGKRAVVAISGKNFSPQIGVLINGVPLVHSIGLAQPLIRDDSEAGRLTAEDMKDAEVVGRVERVDAEKVIFSFKMPSDFQGTPTITLVAPGRAVDINWLNLEINGTANTTLTDFTPKMFGHGPGPDPFRIDKVRVFRTSDPTILTALVSGAGFLDTSGATPRSMVSKILVNGLSLVPTMPESASLLSVSFYVPKDETIKVTLVSAHSDPKRLTVESDPVTNPSFLSVSDVEVTTYESEAEGEPATLLINIKGTGFTDKLKATVNGRSLDVAVKSATQAVFTMPDPKAAAIVTIEDDTGQKAKVVVTRKSKRP